MSILANHYSIKYIGSWVSILTTNDGQNPLQEYIYILMDEHSSESNKFNYKMDESILANPLQEYLSFCSFLSKGTKGEVTMITIRNGQIVEGRGYHRNHF